MWKPKRPSKTILKKNKSEGLKSPDYNITVIKYSRDIGVLVDHRSMEQNRKYRSFLTKDSRSLENEDLF